jgi:hypothetical protein
MITEQNMSRFKRGNGVSIRWLRAQVGWQSDECLFWPFGKSNGYGVFGYLGEAYYAHRYMCELVNGPPPSDDYEAAHSCGRGAQGCINPRHLDWKTRTDNQLDRALHGTKATGPRGKIKPEDAEQIRILRDYLPQREIAAMFGISRSNVSFIHCDKAWNKPPRAVRYFPEKGWRVRIKEEGRIIVVGFFESQDAACDAYETRIGRKAA